MQEINLILFDETSVRTALLPFTFTRPVADIRIGILTIREKWEKSFNISSSIITESYLSKKFPVITKDDNLLVNGSILPDKNLVKEISALKAGEALVNGKTLIAVRVLKRQANDFNAEEVLKKSKRKEYKPAFLQIAKLWNIFSKNGAALESDFNLLTKGRKSQKLNNTNTVLGKNIFIEKGAKVNCSILNATIGPIYIGKDAEVMEGSIIRGPFALCEHSLTKLGTKIYGATTIGPYSKVGGEINNSVIFGYSNKAHDGFLGNSVIGEWCNLGADTNNSNLKNNYGNVKLWSYVKGKQVDTGLQFCGLFMGDHSKCGINTMFNTGTVVGVSANIFGAGFPPNFIPSFSWGGAAGLTEYDFSKSLEVAGKVMERREIKLTKDDKAIMQHIFRSTKK